MSDQVEFFNESDKRNIGVKLVYKFPTVVEIATLLESGNSLETYLGKMIFDTIEKVEDHENMFTFTGVLEGQNVDFSVTFDYNKQSGHYLA
ncbi:MAG: hypothetical protein AAGF07_02820 [Patescibacteria group bacterium]